MLSKTYKAGVLEFIISLAVILLLQTIGSFISFILPSYKVLGHIIGIVLIAFYGRYVLRCYCSVITYEEGKRGITVSRMIGMRQKEISLPYGKITYFSHVKPENTKINAFTAHIFPKKGDVYITDNAQNTVRISDPDGQIYSLLSKKAAANNRKD